MATQERKREREKREKIERKTKFFPQKKANEITYLMNRKEKFV